MLERTRDVLQQLSDEVTVSVLIALSAQDGDHRDIAKRIASGVTAGTVRERLLGLKALGLVRSERVWSGKPGRPTERYSLADPHVLAQLDRRADALVLWLLDVLAERQGTAHRDAVSEGLREFQEGKETG